MYTGTFVFEEEETATFLVGSLDLRVWSRAGEWRLAVVYDRDPLLDRASVTKPAGPWSPPPGAKLQRVASDAGDRVLVLEVALADRDVVVRPDPPLTVLPGDAVQIFVGTPLWLRVLTGDGRTIAEIPTVRMTHTWFGPSPREGELCYALRSRARVSAAEMPRRPHRAIAVLSVTNEADDRLVLERLKVPVPHLAVFRAEDGSHWTQSLSIVRSRGRDDAKVQVDAGPPEVAGSVESVADARLRGTPGMLVRAFDALLS